MNPDTRGLLLLITIPLSIVAGIHWLLIRFTHWSLSVALAVFVSLAFSAIFVGYANATPNGGNRKISNRKYLLPLAIVFAIQLPIMWVWSVRAGGVFTSASYWTIGILCASVILFLVGHGVFDMLDNRAFYAKSFSKCQLKVELLDAKVTVYEMEFEGGVSNRIDLERSGQTLYDEVYAMPRFTHKLRFKYKHPQKRSVLEIDIPVDYKLFKETYAFPEIKYLETFFFRHWDILPVKVIIGTDGTVKIFAADHLVKQIKID